LGCRETNTGIFDALIAACGGLEASQIAYVGDRLDINDTVPALKVGLVAVFVRRGPWGHQQRHAPDKIKADLTVNAMTELPDALLRHNQEQEERMESLGICNQARAVVDAIRSRVSCELVVPAQ
jgi:hypothetical protein